jgi:hypothetical protein
MDAVGLSNIKWKQSNAPNFTFVKKKKILTLTAATFSGITSLIYMLKLG